MAFNASSRMEGMFYFQPGKLTLNDAERCMVIAIGNEFGEIKDDKLLSELQILPDKDPDTNIAVHNAIKLRSTPIFYAEFRLISNSDKGADPSVFTFVPKFIHYPDFVSNDAIFKKPERDVLLSVDFIEAGDNEAFGTMEIQWTGIRKGQISNEAFRSRKLPWIALPASANNLTLPKGVRPAPLFPVNIKAKLIETTKPHTLAKYVGEALKAEKDTITQAAKEAVEYSLSQEARLSAKNVAITDIESKYKTYLDLYDAASAAHGQYQAHAPGDAVGKQKSALAAKIAYQKLSLAETALKRSYDSAGIGMNGLLPPLPAIQ